MTDQRYMLDTNICIYAIEALSPALRMKLAEQEPGTVIVSSISLAELALGFGGSVLDKPGPSAFLQQIPPLAFDEKAALAYGRLPFKRNRFDRLIAAHALALDLILVTNNEADFGDLPELKIENWTK